MLRIVTISVLSVMFVKLGATAAAWRRGCVRIARNVAIARWIEEGGDGPPGITSLKQHHIIRFTPSWVSFRHVCALVLLLFTTLLSLVFFRWYVGVCVALANYIGAEAVAFLLPHRDSPYYRAQVYDSFRMQRDIASRFADEIVAADMEGRLRDLELAYGKELAAMAQLFSVDRRSGPTTQQPPSSTVQTSGVDPDKLRED